MGTDAKKLPQLHQWVSVTSWGQQPLQRQEPRRQEERKDLQEGAGGGGRGRRRASWPSCPSWAWAPSTRRSAARSGRRPFGFLGLRKVFCIFRIFFIFFDSWNRGRRWQIVRRTFAKVMHYSANIHLITQATILKNGGAKRPAGLPRDMLSKCLIMLKMLG